MADATNIEKKSLEAHVELCAERYNALEVRLDHVDGKISKLEEIICEVRDLVIKMNAKRSSQIINWGFSIIGVLLTVIAFFVVRYIIP